MEFEKIIFYYPSRVTGGAEYLFIRCAEWLVTNQSKYKICYVDYSDGFARKIIKSPNIEFYEIEDGQIFKVPNHSIVIVQLNIISHLSLFSYDKQNTAFLFWALHFLNLKAQFYSRGIFTLSKKERKELGACVENLAQKNVIKFMTQLAYAYILKDLYRPVGNFEWLPNIVPIDDSINNNTYKRLEKGRIKCCWLGRLDREKYRNIITYMNELEIINKEYPVSFSIIGLGETEAKIRENAKRYSYPISFIGEKRDKELDTFIRNEVEIGLASGTSAFEFSFRGKPVVVEWVIPRIYKAGERNTYTLTYESEDVTIHNNKIEFVNQDYFRAKFLEIIMDYEGVSKRCFDFTIKKSPQMCCNILLKTINHISTMSPMDYVSDIEKISTILNRGTNRMVFISNLMRLNINALFKMEK